MDFRVSCYNKTAIAENDLNHKSNGRNGMRCDRFKF